MVSVAEGYDNLTFEGYQILDLNRDGEVDHHEKEFRFILGNKVEKDNRIPPAGFNRAAYMADAAFIVPRDALDNDYAEVQNWDDTSYRIRLPWWVWRGPLRITATLKYQSFSGDFVGFLKKEDDEKTEEHGGRARNIPKTGMYGGYQHWGEVLQDN